MKLIAAVLILQLSLILGCESEPADKNDWQMGPFKKYTANPVITPQGSDWESKDVFNPAAWSDGETIYMLYRAEDSTGIGKAK